MSDSELCQAVDLQAALEEDGDDAEPTSDDEEK
jgi:hypothetical protein